MLQLKSVAKFTLAVLLSSSGLSGIAKASVVTSIKPLGFIAAAIADGVTPVEVVLPAGASEHEYSLKPSDIRRIQGGELLIWVGPEMEAFVTRIAAQRDPNKTLELAALPQVKSQLIADSDIPHDHTGPQQGQKSAVQEANLEHSHRKQQISDSHHHHGQYNMHIWLSPQIALVSAAAIHDRLVAMMPQQKTRLDSNLAKFKASLDTTEKRIRTQLAPLRDKQYFVFHDAYRYFENQYQLSPAGYFTVNPEIQPGAQRLHQIRTALVQHKAVCVFAEPQFRPAVIDAVARGTQVRKGTLDPLGTDISLTADSYMKFLLQLSTQYASCLTGNNEEK